MASVLSQVTICESLQLVTGYSGTYISAEHLGAHGLLLLLGFPLLQLGLLAHRLRFLVVWLQLQHGSCIFRGRIELAKCKLGFPSPEECLDILGVESQSLTTIKLCTFG